MAKLYNILLILAQGIFIAYDITYFRDAGLPLVFITLASSWFDISSSIMEIPTSLFFDKVSPKITLAVGNITRLVGFVLFAVNPSSFICVGVGQVLTGIGSATESGAVSALYVNERKEGESSFEKIMGELSEFGSISMLVGGLLGAILYPLGSYFIWVLPAIIYATASVLLIRMPMNNVMEQGATHCKTLLHEFSLSARKALTSASWWMLLCVETASLSMYFLWQIRLGDSNHNQVWNQFGGLIIMNIAGYVAGKLSQKVSLSYVRRSLIVIVTNVVLCIILAWSSGFWVGILLYFPHVVLLSWMQNKYAGDIHMSLEDNERATVFSLQSAAIALCAVFVGPVCGWLTDTYGLGIGMSSTLIFFIIPIIRECSRGYKNMNGRKEQK